MSRDYPSNLEFRGRDLKECEQFISAVNNHARAQGRLRDDQWIADLVAVCIAGDAMLWWSALDEETQGSWRLLQKAMLLRYRLQFAGRSGAEAENFVHWVRQRALDVGKINDPHWAAELASGCFVGSALRWYTSLDAEIRGDWDSLQQAIFVQYGQNFQEGSLSSTVPTPAAAATAPTLSNRRVRGRIQVRRKDGSQTYYLSKILNTERNYLGRVMLTQRGAEALEVEYEFTHPLDDSRILFIPDNQLPGCDALGMKSKMTDKTATANVQALCGIDLSSGAGSPGPLFVGAILTKPWKISRPADGAGTRSVSVVDESGDYLQPVSGQTGYLWFINTKLEKAVGIDMVLFFEPV